MIQRKRNSIAFILACLLWGAQWPAYSSGTAAGFVQSGQTTAQQAQSKIMDWLAAQNTILADVRNVQLKEFVRTSIDAGEGARNYAIDARRSVERIGGLRDSGFAFVSERSVVALRANGREIDDQRAQRFLEQQRRTFRPEMVRLFESFGFPGSGPFDWADVNKPILVERDGKSFWRVGGKLSLQTPFGPQRGPRMGGPPGGPPGGDQGRPRNRPEPVFTAWFTVGTFRLHATRIEVPLPNRFSLSILTTYFAIDGIDSPSKRIIEGTIPVRRRNRTYSIRFRQVLNYSDYIFLLD
jgi:hypothetical protein